MFFILFKNFKFFNFKVFFKKLKKRCTYKDYVGLQLIITVDGGNRNRFFQLFSGQLINLPFIHIITKKDAKI